MFFGAAKGVGNVNILTQNTHCASVQGDGYVQELVVAAQLWEGMRSGISLAFAKHFSRYRELKALFLL